MVYIRVENTKLLVVFDLFFENKKINFEIDDVGNMTEKAQVIFTEFNQRIERLPNDKKKKVNNLLIRIEKILMAEE